MLPCMTFNQQISQSGHVTVYQDHTAVILCKFSYHNSSFKRKQKARHQSRDRMMRNSRSALPRHKTMYLQNKTLTSHGWTDSESGLGESCEYHGFPCGLSSVVGKFGFCWWVWLYSDFCVVYFLLHSGFSLSLLSGIFYGVSFLPVQYMKLCDDHAHSCYGVWMVIWI